MNGRRAILVGALLLLPFVLTAAVEKEPLKKIDLSPEPKVKQDHCLALSPNGNLVAGAQPVSAMTGKPPFEIRIWDASNGKEVQIFKDKLPFEVLDMQFSGDGKTLMTSSVRLLTERRPPRREDRGKPPGQEVFRTRTDIKLWDVESGKLRSALSFPFSVALCALSPDGQTVAVEEFVAGTGRNVDFTVVKLYDVSTAKTKVRATLPSASEPVAVCTGIRFFPNSKHVAAVLCKRKGVQFTWELGVWETATGKQQGVVQELKDNPEVEFQIERIFWSTEPAMLALTASRKEKADKVDNAKASYSTGIWDLANYRETPRVSFKHDDPINRIVFSAEGGLALTVSRFGQKDEKPFHFVQLWDLSTGKETPVPGHKDLKGDITARFSPDGKFLALADSEGRLKFWDLAKNVQIFNYESSKPARFDPLVFSPDGKTLASVENGRTVKLWEVADGKELATFTPTMDWGMKKDLRFTADGKKLVAFDGKTFTQWEAEAK